MKSPIVFLNTDSRILDLMKKGDEDALVLLYESNRRMVTSLVVRNGGSEDDAEDMLQETVIVLWERVRAGRFELTAKISTFIYATVQHMWNRRRSRLIRESPTDLSEDTTIDEGGSPLDALMENDLSRAIASALNRLGDPCKTLLLLFYWEECSMEEIARRLKFANTDTAKSKKYQCKKALEKILTDERII